MWYRFLSKISFLLQATNQHGVHSPFMYLFVKEAMYGKNPKGISVRHKPALLYRVIAYFQLKNIIFLEKDTALQKNIATDFRAITHITDQVADLIYVSKIHMDTPGVLEQIPKNTDTIIFCKLHRDTPNEKQDLSKLIAQEYVRAHVITFSYAIVFLRKQQPKQQFLIRDKNWFIPFKK